MLGPQPILLNDFGQWPTGNDSWSYTDRQTDQQTDQQTDKLDACLTLTWTHIVRMFIHVDIPTNRRLMRTISHDRITLNRWNDNLVIQLMNGNKWVKNKEINPIGLGRPNKTNKQENKTKNISKQHQWEKRGETNQSTDYFKATNVIKQHQRSRRVNDDKRRRGQ